MPTAKFVKILSTCGLVWLFVLIVQSGTAKSDSHHLFQVQIQNSDGFPIVGVTVRLLDAKGKKIGPKQKTDVGGMVRFDVPGGKYSARVRYLKSEFRSPEYKVTRSVSKRFTIPHKEVKIKVQGLFRKLAPLSAVPVQLYSEDGKKLSQKQYTDSLGQAVFFLPERPYKVRVHCLKRFYESEAFIWQNTAITIPMGQADVQVYQKGEPVSGAKLRMISPGNRKIGRALKTNARGKATFTLPAGAYKCIVKYKGNTFIRDQITIKASALTSATIDLSPISVRLTADRRSVMFNEAVTLSWNVSGADTCTLTPGIGPVDCCGRQVLWPQQTTTYRITASRVGDSVSDSVNVAVFQPDGLQLGYLDNEYQGGGGLVGDTVRVLNGNVVLQRNDVRIPSPHQLGLSLQSVYNSRSTFAGAMGFGWTHSYDVALSHVLRDGDRTVIRLMDPTGRIRYFRGEAGGRFQGMYHEPSYLTQTAEGYIWHRIDGARWGLSSTGRLQRIEDRHGNQLILQYTLDEQLTEVKDLSGNRSLSFEYTQNGLLAAVYGPVIDSMPDDRWASFEYDDNRNLVYVRYADGSGHRYTYADPGDPHNITQQTDILNHLLNTWAYDENDKVIQNTDRNDAKTRFVYANNLLVEVIDAYGIKRAYALATIGAQKMVAALKGSAPIHAGDNPAVRWQYDSRLNLVEIQYASGLICRFREHDSRGNPGTVTIAPESPHERIIKYTYHPQLQVPLTRRENSVLGDGEKVTVWDYDRDGNTIPNEMPSKRLGQMIEQGFTADATGQVAPYEYIRSFEYSSKGQLLIIDGALPGTEDVIHLTYDPENSNLLRISRPLIGRTTFSNYDAAGRVGLITDVNGQSTRISYDARGRITAAAHASDGSSAAVSYTIAGLIEALSDEDQVAYGYSYDQTHGRLESVTDAKGHKIRFGYDEWGNLIAKSIYSNIGALTGSKRWSYQHPAYPGRLWREILSDGSFTEYDYNSAGQIIEMTDPKGNATIYAYDRFGRLSFATRALDVITRYRYDHHGHLAVVTDAESGTTTYVNDDLGRVIKRLSPDSGEILYAYDASGNLVSKTDANHVTAQYLYDSLNRLTAVRYPDPIDDISFSYDEGPFGMGRLTGMRDAAGSTTYKYNDKGQRVERTVAFYGNDYVLRADYTSAGRLSALHYPSGRTVEYFRGTNGKITGVQSSHKGRTTSLVKDLAYHPFGGGLSGMKTGSEGRVSNQSGACGCLTLANPGEDMEQQYHYDSNGNLTALETIHYPALDQHYTYDALNRVIAAQGPFGTAAYTYDKVGNRLSRRLNGQSELYTYQPDTNRLVHISGETEQILAYDGCGNTISTGELALYYNQSNRLIRVEKDHEIVGEYTYNAIGQRLIKETPEKTTLFHYDFDGNIIGESLPDGSMTAEYIYMGKSRLATVDANTGEVYYFLNDHLGTPQYLTNESGMAIWEAIYKPFGEAELNPNSKIENNFRFPGQYYDAETGLHYNYHRYYDSDTGRYLRVDPIGFRGGINLYTYAGLNPINLIDTSGLFEYQYTLEAISSGTKLFAHSFFQPAIEANGIILTITEFGESFLQRINDRNWTPASVDQIKEFGFHLLAYGGAEIVEMNLWVLELFARGMEDSLQECTQKKYDISNLIKKYRAKASGDSGILRLYINQFIAGGAKNETWVTPSRKENSNYGGINKSIISEEYGKLLYNLRKITH